MSQTVDYYFATASPFTYLGHARFVEIARRHGATVHYKPVNALEVFAASGGLPVNQRPPQRQAYRLAELARWREYLGMPLNLHPKHFPVAGTLAAQTIIAAMEQGEDPAALTGAILAAVWAEERNIDDPATVREIAAGAGYDNLAFVDRAHLPTVAARLEAFTREAIGRQVFGVPTYVVSGELYWGQDRLDFVERALAQQ